MHGRIDVRAHLPGRDRLLVQLRATGPRRTGEVAPPVTAEATVSEQVEPPLVLAAAHVVRAAHDRAIHVGRPGR